MFLRLYKEYLLAIVRNMVQQAGNKKTPRYPLDEDAAFNDDSNTVVAVCRKTMPSSATQPVYINPQK